MSGFKKMAAGKVCALTARMLFRQCYEKVFYFLLEKHRNKRLEDYSEPVGNMGAGRISEPSRVD